MAKPYQFVALGAAGIALVATGVVLNLNHAPTGSGKITGTITTDNGDLKINWDRYPTYEVNLNEHYSYTITASGTYHLTGSLTSGAIIINASSDNVVKLVLDNVTIKNPNGPAIACYNADDLVIELVGDNTIEDASKYDASYDEDVQGAIYSKSDLTFQGNGTLSLTAHYQDGIVSKDDLKFNSGTYNITAADDAIRGKDSVYIVGGTYNLTATADAIKSTNETDGNKGFVLIEDGNFTIKSGAKGIKSINSTLIYDGSFVITSTDDSIHSNNYVGIAGGNFTLTSSDDGVHADRELIIDGGKINIKKSYEGLEAQAITINAGEISIVASDDGINAGGGADSSAMNRPGAGAFDANTSCVLIIAGGNIYVNASGDGIDSNGYIYFNGGTVTVDGPTNNGNGALDTGVSIQQNGGTVIAIGASGMAETLGSTSGVYNASIYFTSVQAAGTTIEIKNSAGNTIIEHTSAKTFNHMAVGTPDFKSGETYTVYVNGEQYQSFTISAITTTVGNSNQNYNNMMQNGGRR
ncbi:carbohydrate-binding domain-containing protein [Candidatus Saccharibacteria bacterium]|nr:carbohydrate-binding domain-containing protein [Candidatus Saccharibacteria bacterium]